MITAEFRKVERTGTASMGWHMGRGYVNTKIAVSSSVWCVVEDGKVLLEARSRSIAELVAAKLAGTY